MKQIFSTIAMALLTIIGFTGCNSHPETPEELVKAYMDARMELDMEALVELSYIDDELSDSEKEAQREERLARLEAFQEKLKSSEGKTNKIVNYEIKSIKVDGDKARALVIAERKDANTEKITKERMRLRLRKALDDKWYVSNWH